MQFLVGSHAIGILTKSVTVSIVSHEDLAD